MGAIVCGEIAGPHPLNPRHGRLHTNMERTGGLFSFSNPLLALQHDPMSLRDPIVPSTRARLGEEVT